MHTLLQSKLCDLLRPRARPGSYLEVELPFRALPEYELRVADVEYLSAERLAASDPEGNVRGAPDIVIEAFSPSNSATEINEKEMLCLENGAQDFGSWTRTGAK